MPRDQIDQTEVLARIPIHPKIEMRSGRPFEFGIGAVDPDFFRDAAIVNGYLEKVGEKLVAVKRPGFRAHFDLRPSDAVHGFFHYQGSPTPNDALYFPNDFMFVSVDTDLLVNPDIEMGTGEVMKSVATSVWAASTGGFTTYVQFAGAATIMAIVSNRGGLTQVYTSTDEGTTWTLKTSAPGWVAREKFRAVYNGTHVYIMGGTNAAGTRLNDVWRTSASDGASWSQQTAAAPWAARHSFGACRGVGTSLLIGGGDTAGGDVNDVWTTLDGASWTLQTAAAAWSARDGLGMVRALSLLWVVGGSDTGRADAWYSADSGINWVLSNPDVGLGPVNASNVALWSATKNGTEWLTVLGFDGDSYARTRDGLNWQTYSNSTSFGLLPEDGAVIHNGIQLVGNRSSARGDILNDIPSRNPLDGWFHDLWPNGFDFRVATSDVQAVHFEPIPTDPTDLRDRSDELEGVLIKSRFDAYFYNTKYKRLEKITADGYPRETVDGSAWLDGRFYVMTTEGRIHGSDINAPFGWSSLNFVSAIRHPDQGVAIMRRHNYILAWGVDSMEWFYDSGELAGSVGSVLRRVDSAASDFGCLHAGGVQRIGGNLIWVGQTGKVRERGVYVIDGYQPRKVSTPFIDRIIDSSDFDCVWSGVISIQGHRLYYLTLCCIVTTVVYDIDMDAWYLWNTEANFRSTTPTLTAALDTTSGLVEVTVTAATLSQAITAASVGDPIRVQDAAQTDYNGFFSINRILSSTSFTYMLPTSTLPTTPATGTITLDMFPIFGAGEFLPGLTAPMSTFSNPSPLGGEFTGSRQFALTLGNFVGVVQIADEYTADDYRSSAPGTTEGTFDHYINFWVRTPRVDFDNNLAKFVSRCEVIGDTEDTQVHIRYSDDDYTNFSPYRAVDMAAQRPRISRQGRTRRRSYDIRHVDPTKRMRIEGLEVFLKIGNRT